MRIFQKDNLFDRKAKVNRNIFTTLLVKLVRLGERVWMLGWLLARQF